MFSSSFFYDLVYIIATFLLSGMYGFYHNWLAISFSSQCKVLVHFVDLCNI